MASIAPLALTDGGATTRTFAVNTSQEGFNNPAVWLEKTAGSYAGYLKASLLVKRTPNGSTTRVSLRVTVPTVDVDGTPVRQCQANLSFVMPDTGTLAEREDLLAYVVSALSTSAVEDAVHNHNPVY